MKYNLLRQLSTIHNVIRKLITFFVSKLKSKKIATMPVPLSLEESIETDWYQFSKDFDSQNGTNLSHSELVHKYPNVSISVNSSGISRPIWDIKSLGSYAKFLITRTASVEGLSLKKPQLSK